jgi:hypothetical protein
VEKFVDYSLEGFSKNANSSLANCHSILIQDVSLYFSTTNRLRAVWISANPTVTWITRRGESFPQSTMNSK